MALKTKLSVDSVDSTGRIFNIHDSTGLYNASTNTGGYGFPNTEISDISSIVFTVSKYKTDKICSVKYVRIYDPLKPEHLISPTIPEIANGKEINLTSTILGITTPEEGLKEFKDGIYDITMYTILNAIGPVTNGTKGSYKLSINDASVFDDYFYINIGDNIYTIDKSKTNSTVDNLSLYTIEPLKEDYVDAEISLVNFANEKAFNDANTNCCIENGSYKLILDKCCNPCEDKFEKIFFKLIMYKMVARINFNMCNYDKADELLDGSSRGCKSLKCNCR